MKALARAFLYQRLLNEGRDASISEMAAAERLDRGYTGGLLRLTLLAPEIVDATLDGRQQADLGLPNMSFPAGGASLLVASRSGAIFTPS